MNVQLAVLADAANVAPTEKLNIMGCFDTIFVRQFPAIHPSMVLAMRLRLDFDDGSGKKEIKVEMVDEDGKKYLEAIGVLEIPQIPPGEHATTNHILNFANMGFTKPGKYSFRIMWEGKEVERVDLRVADAPPVQAK